MEYKVAKDKYHNLIDNSVNLVIHVCIYKYIMNFDYLYFGVTSHTYKCSLKKYMKIELLQSSN